MMKSFERYALSGLFVVYAAGLVSHAYHQRMLYQTLKKISSHDSEIITMLQEESCNRIGTIINRQT